MTDAILFNGFITPDENWSKLPHQLIDALPLIDSEGECKVILYILRHTWGYRDTEKKITIDEFCNGRKRKDGSRIDGGTGMSVNAVRLGLKKAVVHGFIIHEQDKSDLARIRNYFKLRMSEDDFRGSDSDRLESESNTHESESDSRSEKETIRKKPAERKKQGRAKAARRQPSDPPPDYFPKDVQGLANIFMRQFPGLQCKTMSEYNFWIYGNNKSMPPQQGLKQMANLGCTVEDMLKATQLAKKANLTISYPSSIWTTIQQVRLKRNGRNPTPANAESGYDPAFDQAVN